MGKIFFFLSSNAVYNDKVLPVILHLAHQGNQVESIVLSAGAEIYMNRSGSYALWLKKLTKMRRLIQGEGLTARFIQGGRLTLLERITFHFKCIPLWFEMMFRKRYLAFFDIRSNANLIPLVGYLARKRGKIIFYTGWYVDNWAGLDWERILSNKEYREKLGKKKASGPKSEEDSLSGRGTVLAYNEELVGHKWCKGDEYRVVPHPKMQAWWHSFVRDHLPADDGFNLRSLDKWVSVFLTHRGNYLFRENSDLDVLLKDILGSIRAVFPQTPIVIKPKINLGKSDEQYWLSDYLRRLNFEGVIVSYEPIALLAQKSLVGITTGHTTGQFEFMVTEAPWIEYCRYSDFWKEVYPELTYTKKFGGWWAQTPEELEQFLNKIKKGKLRTDLEKWKKQINFFPQNVSFGFFMDSGSVLN